MLLINLWVKESTIVYGLAINMAYWIITALERLTEQAEGDICFPIQLIRGSTVENS